MPSNNKTGANDGIGEDSLSTTALTPAQINEENKKFWQRPGVGDSSGAFLTGELEKPERKIRATTHGGDATTPKQRIINKTKNPTKYPQTGSHGHSPEQVTERLAKRHGQPAVAGERLAEAVVENRAKRVGPRKYSSAFHAGEKKNTLV